MFTSLMSRFENRIVIGGTRFAGTATATAVLRKMHIDYADEWSRGGVR